MKRLAIFLLAMLPVVALADDLPFGKNDRPAWNPPARFDRPYDGKLFEFRLPQQAVARYCVKLSKHYYGVDKPQNPHQRGCAVPMDGWCIIAYIDRPYGLSTPDAVRRHEIGHCNGWHGSHPK